LVYGGLEALRLLEKSLFSECLSDALVFFTFQSANGLISAGAPVRFWADRHISPCFLQFRVISRNTLISGASVARKVVVFKVSARCLRVSSEFLNDSDDFTENDIFQDGSSEPGAQIAIFGKTDRRKSRYQRGFNRKCMSR
jgi:hypothetical protein